MAQSHTDALSPQQEQQQHAHMHKKGMEALERAIRLRIGVAWEYREEKRRAAGRSRTGPRPADLFPPGDMLHDGMDGDDLDDATPAFGETGGDGRLLADRGVSEGSLVADLPGIFQRQEVANGGDAVIDTRQLRRSREMVDHLIDMVDGGRACVEVVAEITATCDMLRSVSNQLLVRQLRACRLPLAGGTEALSTDRGAGNGGAPHGGDDGANGLSAAHGAWVVDGTNGLGG